ncbi:hypothetical protein LJR034_003511 [Caballeronia sp. LjRoot34]|uniref:hypothetical protein n=1 Tax=Caballeronia sp. LjRoot34 TaxID=3342325 RepID=UPI003ECCFC59
MLFLLGSWLGRIFCGNGFASAQRQGKSARRPKLSSLAAWQLLGLTIIFFMAMAAPQNSVNEASANGLNIRK